MNFWREIGQMAAAPWWRPLALALLLLAVTAARLLHIAEVNLHLDELWALWQGMGSLADVIRWSAYDWPPLYFLALDIWQHFVGSETLALRYLSVLSFMIGAAFLYRAVQREANDSAAAFAVAIFGSIAIIKFLSTEIRGYAFMLMFVPMAWYAACCLYRRPRRWHIALFAFAAAGAVYSTYVSVLPLSLFVGYAIWMRRRRRWRDLRPLLIACLAGALLVLPQVMYILPLVARRFGRVPAKSLREIWVIWLGPGPLLMGVLFLFALAALLWRPRMTRVERFALFWGLFMLLAMYALNDWFGLIGEKYLSWILIGVAVFLGTQIGKLPPLGRVVPAICCCLLLAQPFPWYEEYSHELAKRLDLNLEFLRDEMHADDVVLFADGHECYSGYGEFELMMHMHLRFPNGMRFAERLDGQRRVWFVTAHGSPDSPHWETLRRDYVERNFSGPPGCLFRLYEGPPHREGLLFENGLRFHGADFLRDGAPAPPGLPAYLHEGERFRARLWWTVDERLARDYSVGVFLMDAQGWVMSQLHGPPIPVYPMGAPRQTSRWQPGQLYYEEREFVLPEPLDTQALALRLAVYHWEEPEQRFSAPGANALGMLPALQLVVISW